MQLIDMSFDDENAPSRHQIVYEGDTYEFLHWPKVSDNEPLTWDVLKYDGDTRSSYAHIVLVDDTVKLFQVHPWHHYIPPIGKYVRADMEGILKVLHKFHMDRDREFAENAGSERGFSALEWAVQNAPLKSGFRKSLRLEAYTIPIYDALPRQLVTLRFEVEQRTIDTYDLNNNPSRETLDFGPDGKYSCQCRHPDGYQDIRLFDDPRDAVLSAIEASNSAYT